jgi:predicted transcriptional regulator
MNKNTFNGFMQDMCKLLKGKGMSITEISEVIDVNKSSLYGYIGNIEKQWCPERKHNSIIEKFKSLVGDEMVYVLDKYNMVQKVIIDKNETGEEKPKQSPQTILEDVYTIDDIANRASLLELDLKNLHSSITNKIETLEEELKNLKDQEKTVRETIQNLNILKDIKR